MDADDDERRSNMTLKSRRRWILWGPLLLIAVLSTVRFVLLTTNLQQANGFDVLLLTLVLGILLIGGILVPYSLSIGRSIPRLRAMYPDAVVAPMLLRADNLDTFQALTGVSLWRERSHGMDVTFEPSTVQFWRGRKPRLIGRISADALEFKLGEITTPAGSFPALLMTVTAEKRTYSFRFVPMNAQSWLYPKQLNRAQTEGLISELNGRTRIPPVG